MCAAFHFFIHNGVLDFYTGRGENVVIPKGVTVISDSAFYRDSHLKSVTLPEGLTSIGANAFSECRNLKTVNIPGSVTSIGDGAFYLCTCLTGTSVPEHVTDVGKKAFWGCRSLADQDGFVIVRHVLYDYFGQAPQVTVPDGVTSIGEAAFSRFQNATAVTLPESVTDISRNAFEDCRGLQTLICPEHIKDLRSALTFCHHIKMLVLPGIAPENLEYSEHKIAAAIGYLAFGERYRDPAIVQSYHQYICRHTKKLLAFLFDQDLAQGIARLADMGKITVKNFDSDFFQPATAANATGCVAFLLNWKARNFSAGDIEKQIIRDLMKDPYNITDMKKLWSYEKLPDGSMCITGYKGTGTSLHIPPRIGNTPVTAIGQQAFSTNKSRRTVDRRQFLMQLQSVTVPDSVTSIGNQAFLGCVSLTSLSIPADCSVDSGAFFRCTSLADKDGFVIVNHVLFDYCGSDAHIRIPDGVTVISGAAFYSCASLTTLTVPQGCTTIENSALCFCTNLTSVSLPESLTSIGPNAFYYCRQLKDITIPEGVTFIGPQAFSDCKALADANGFIIVRHILHAYCEKPGPVIIPEGVTAIYDCAFMRCHTLVSVTIPRSVTTIGYDAFHGCSRLASVTLPEGVTVIKDCAFGRCRRLASVILPASITSIGRLAFPKKTTLLVHPGSYAQQYARENEFPFTTV